MTYGPALRHVLFSRSTRFGAESRAKREKKIAAALVFSALGARTYRHLEDHLLGGLPGEHVELLNLFVRAKRVFHGPGRENERSETIHVGGGDSVTGASRDLKK